MKKFIIKLHKWLAIPAGLIITIVCLTGAALVFKDEILEWSDPDLYFVDKVMEAPLPLDSLVPLINSQLENNTVANVKISADPKRTYSMTLTEGFRVSALVDPYTGELKGIYETRENIFWDIMILHRWLMDGSRTWGKYTVGICTILFVFILISGFELWKPRKKKHWKPSLTIKTKSGRRRLFYDLHNVLGAYASVLLIILSLTGLMWSFEWYRNGVFAIFGAETESNERGGGKGNNGGKSKEKPQVNTIHWQSVFEQVKASNPGYEYIRVQDETIAVHSKKAMVSRDTDSYKFDAKTGEITQVNLYSEGPKTTRIWGWAYSLHVGDYWGVWSKILTCLASLIGASLPLTGYYLTYINWKKKRVRQKKEKKKN